MNAVAVSRRERFRFFLEHAGYSSPPGRAACALAMARLEEVLDEAIDLGVAEFEMLDDDMPYDPGDVVSEDEAARLFESGKWTGPFGVTLDVGDEGSSLWGIVVGPDAENDPYLRVVRTEIAFELEDELRQAIGDTKDAAQEIPA